MLKVNNLTKRNVVDDVSFSLHQGEVVGFFGLEGSGTNTLSRMLYGLEGKEKGEIVFKGETLQKLNSSTLVEKKILYLNNNRKKAGLLLDSPSCENMILPVIDRMSRRTILLKRKMQDYTEKYIKTFSITISSIFQKPRNLSGGNQQKLMLSICLGTSPELLIVNEPTRGIDVGAKAEINRFLLDIVNKGIGLIVFSSELPELMSLCDRIIIMKQKHIVGELKGDEITEEAVIGLAAGGQ
jgi:ABC-type sugar transport system ATPase subunit